MAKIDRSKVKGAASLLEKHKPELAKAAKSLREDYRLEWPGMGLFLSPLEALYNQTAEYDAENLEAGVDAVAAIIKGLNKTVANYDNAEDINATNLQGKPSGKTETGYLHGLGNAGFFNTNSPTGNATGWETAGTIIDYSAMAVAEMTALLCTVLSPPFIPALLAASGLLCNVPSMFSTANDLSDIQAQIDHFTDQFDAATKLATDDWDDDSVTAFTDVTTKVKSELGDISASLAGLGSYLQTVGGALLAFWLAFIPFIVPFLATLTAEQAAPPEGQAAAQAEGAAAGITWSTVAETVIMGLAGIAVAYISLNGSLDTRDDIGGQGGDDTPDLKQIKIEWH